LKLIALADVTDLTPLLGLPIKELELGHLGRISVSSQLLLKIPSLKKVRFYYLGEEREHELEELIKQKPSFKIYHDRKLLNP
jgi:hypothetical protein